MSEYREWEARLLVGLADAEAALPAAEYARLCGRLADVCYAEQLERIEAGRGGGHADGEHG